MNKLFVIIVMALIMTVIIAIPISIIKSCSDVNEALNKEENWYKSKIGNKYINNKDTLIIIDFSRLSETFKLSNGIEVNKSLIK